MRSADSEWMTPEDILVRPSYTKEELLGMEPSATRGPACLHGPTVDVPGAPLDDTPVRGVLDGRESNAFTGGTWRRARRALRGLRPPHSRGYDSDLRRVMGDVGKAGVAMIPSST
jgi:methylmalonyl-CoA mutase